MKRESLPTENVLAENFGPNPFLDSLGLYIPYADFAAKLARFPLQSVRLDQVSLSQRDDLLALQKLHFVPASQSQDIAPAMQTVLREHYVSRNPMNPVVRKRVMAIARLRDVEPDQVPSFPNFASGIIIRGITGLGKSAIVERYLDLLPVQVREYTGGEIPGFVYLKQIVWMKVDMSVDGSRGGFLLGILAEVDRLADTDYHEQYSRAKLSIEKLMVRVGIILSTHFCGMLIVEEIQAENFGNTTFMHQLAMFFLRLLNFGVPVVLVGNPLGFDALKSHSQVMRRLTRGGSFFLHPAPSATDWDWDNLLVPGIWAFDVMPKPTILCAEIRALLFEYSGGINDFLFRLRVDSQRIALRLGKDCVTVAHIKQAFAGPNMIDNHGLICGFATRNLGKLSLIEDIPIGYYAALWKSEKSAEDPPGARSDGAAQPRHVDQPPVSKVDSPAQRAAPKQEPGAPRAIVPSVVQKGAQFKSEQTRIENREAKVKTLNTTLPDADMRKNGVRAALIARIEEVKKKLG